jgi:phosphatidylserine decarboxylase
MNTTRPKTSSWLTSRLGGWLPVHPHKLNRWLKDTIDEAEKRSTSFHPVVEEFRFMIESDPVMYMYFSQMFEQQPRFPPPPGSGDVKIKDYHQMLVVMNHVISTAPTYNTTGMVGCPLNAVLDFSMITPAGLSAFLMQKVNTMLRKVLNVWARYLDSEDSLYFWLKAQPYSLRHMLSGHFVDRFSGGTVYQAFLSAKQYHRWHSPVTGIIRKMDLVPGTYYAEAAAEGFDPAGPNDSQGYIAHIATRALIFIEADNPAIGLLCIVLIGMAEVSSCMLVRSQGEPLQEGQRVKKGDQIGYFQFGGSTHCLVFRPGVIAEFAMQAIPQGENGARSAVVKVNSFLAKASS